MMGTSAKAGAKANSYKSGETLEKVIDTLVTAAKPYKILLFGSCARGDVHKDSDLDILLVFHKLENRHMETVRLRRALRPLRIPVDLILATRQEIDDWGHLPGTVFFPALKEGVVLYEAA